MPVKGQEVSLYNGLYHLALLCFSEKRRPTLLISLFFPILHERRVHLLAVRNVILSVSQYLQRLCCTTACVGRVQETKKQRKTY